jgi:hypothetical protein
VISANQFIENQLLNRFHASIATDSDCGLWICDCGIKKSEIENRKSEIKLGRFRKTIKRVRRPAIESFLVFVYGG